MRPFGAAFLEDVMTSPTERTIREPVAPEFPTLWRDGGHTASELLVALAITGLMTVAAIPVLMDAYRAAALRAVAGRIGGLMIRCRIQAVMRGRAVSLVFERRDGHVWRCFLAEDRDGDGVRRDDLQRGRDGLLGEVVHFENSAAGLGILTRVRVPNPTGRGALDGDLSDPVRAGRGDIITFTPRSTATPSSIYMTDHHSRMRVLRVYGGTARVYSKVWRTGWKKWRHSGM
jgi:hypothetical protein